MKKSNQVRCIYWKVSVFAIVLFFCLPFYVEGSETMTFNNKITHVGPFYPLQKEPVLFAMSADDICLFHSIERLTLIHRKCYEHIINGMGRFQTPLILVGDAKDGAIIDSKFLDEAWNDLFEWLYCCFSSLDLPIIPKENLVFFSTETLYSDLAQLAHNYPIISIVSFSHINQQLFDSSKQLEIAQHLNSKMEFIRMASQRNIPVPPSMVTTKESLNSPEVAAFFKEYGPTLIMKQSGGGGGLNVKQVDSSEAAHILLEECPDSVEILLQKKLDLTKYREMTVDFVITDKECRIDNVRNVLVSEGKWIGNHLRRDLTLLEGAMSSN